MPPLSRYFIKTGLIYLLLGLLVGLLQAANTWLKINPLLNAVFPTYLHMLVVGWVTQLIFGVAYWMFPKFSKEQPRRNERMGWAVYGLLNIGLIARVIGEPLLSLRPDWDTGWLLVVSAVTQFGAGWGLVYLLWPRVKER